VFTLHTSKIRTSQFAHNCPVNVTFEYEVINFSSNKMQLETADFAPVPPLGEMD